MWANLSLVTMLFGTLLIVISIIVGPTDPQRASLFYPIGLLAAAIGFSGLLVINQTEASSDKKQNFD